MSWFSNLFAAKTAAHRLSWTAQRLFEQLEHQLQRCMDSDCVTRLGDRDYVSVSDLEAFECVRNVTSNYTPQTNDCDDLAHLAKSEAIRKQRRGAYGGGVAAFGQVWLDHHAINFYLHHTGVLRLIDKNGKLIPAADLDQKITLLLA